MQLESLRAKHLRFIYESFNVQYRAGDLRFSSRFRLLPDIVFEPSTTIKGVERAAWEALSDTMQQNLAFHLGLIEMLSYWKAAASPIIEIKAAHLSPKQVQWWQDLLFNGMGEYFYLNDIDFTVSDFVQIVVADDAPHLTAIDERILDERVLVPVGGGKDSAVTLDILGAGGFKMGTMALNASQATHDTIAVSKSQQSIHVQRRIDPVLIRLNQAGYLNGHTPFSSVLAFISLACAMLFDYRYIALSNERSSNEGNQFFHGVEVNHQYSKTFDFEQRFRAYATEYLAPHVEYFSFLRPIYELQIARLFAEMPIYHDRFRSCNVGQKTNSWCHNCSKCLFVYTMLYPFMSQDQLAHVFTHDLFTREDLLPIAKELVGLSIHKPFECVGTHEESKIAFQLSAEKFKGRGEALPFMLGYLDEHIFSQEGAWEERAQQVLHAWNEAHSIPSDFESLLKDRLDQVRE